MKKLVATVVAAIAAFAMAPAAQAADVVLVPHPSGDLSGIFGEVVTTPGPFTSTFTFNLSRPGTLGATLSTFAVSSATNIDFVTAFLNGTPFSLITLLTPMGQAEFGFVGGISAGSGVQTLVVNGTSGGNGAFAGTISVASAIPEPSTWVMMMLGFGVVGYSLRRRQRSVVAFA